MNTSSNAGSLHPVAHLLLRSGLSIDVSQLEAWMQVRRNAELANLVVPLHQVPSLAVATSTTLTTPGSTAAVGRTGVSGIPRVGQESTIEQEVTNHSYISSNTDAEARGDDSSKSFDQQRVPVKRNPNDLNTAAPVTCLEDFVKMPISTKLNNLKISGKKDEADASAGVSKTLSASDAPPRQFSPNYCPREQDVVVDTAHYPNREFRLLIKQSLPNYLTASSQPKRKSLIRAILSTVSANGGYFLRFRASHQSWAEVDKFTAERFTAQALRDAASQRGTQLASVSEDLSSSQSSNALSTHDLTSSNLSTGGKPYNNFTTSKTSKSQGAQPQQPLRAIRRISERNSFSIARTNPMNEIPITFKKRPSQTVPQFGEGNPLIEDRSVLQVKFKRPRTMQPLRKVSLETPISRNPLEFLSEIAGLDNCSETSSIGKGSCEPNESRNNNEIDSMNKTLFSDDYDCNRD